jgi:DNA polymerase elongation subunit (family B)
MKRLGIVAPNRRLRDHSVEGEEAPSNDFAGAFVKDPIPGLYEWVFDEDMASLYPSIIRTLNISPETKVGRVENWDEVKNDFWTDGYAAANAKIKSGSKHVLIPIMEFRDWLVQNNKGLIPSRLTNEQKIVRIIFFHHNLKKDF